MLVGREMENRSLKNFPSLSPPPNTTMLLLSRLLNCKGQQSAVWPVRAGTGGSILTDDHVRLSTQNNYN